MIDVRSVGLLVLLSGVACSGTPEAIDGVRARIDFDADDFYDAPFPSDHRVTAEGRIDLDDFPNPLRLEMVRSIRQLAAKDTHGFGLTSAVYFSTTGAVDRGRLPSLAESVAASSPIFLVAVSGNVRRHVPILVEFIDDGGPHGAANLLSILPLQGVPLLPNTRYAAVVTRDVLPGVSADMVGLLNDVQPAGMLDAAFEAYTNALNVVEDEGVARDRIGAIAVFTTGDPTIDMTRATKAALDHIPTLTTPFVARETFEDFCVFEARTQMPVFQDGEPPYRPSGGAWVLEGGEPVTQRMAEARVVVTIPRTPAPTAGYPSVVFIRTGGGGDRPLVDRGRRAEEGGAAIEPGTGPARNFARAGFAAISVDGPHGGLRNPKNADEQLLIFNLDNPVAMRDNLRQSALEIVLVRHMLDDLTVTATACSGATSDARFDPDTVALFGHSMGATIAPLALAMEPGFSAAILSGAGGSWIENLIHKQRPLPTKPLAEILLSYADYGDEGASLYEHDPVLSLLQWAGESADPPVYAGSIRAHVLMFQGIADTYIPPPIANALSLSLGADLAGDALEESLEPLLALTERSKIALPATGNRDGRTLVVVQHEKDAVEDGHEVVFQTQGPKHQYRCFLQSLADGGSPTVMIAGAEWDACD